jgi:multidrug efflux pump subunit AcrA (membrane-fusion protein)
VAEHRPGVLAIPVAAVSEGPAGDAAVRVVSGAEDEWRPVELGLVAEGWVEVTAGLEAGEEVRLPG